MIYTFSTEDKDEATDMLKVYDYKSIIGDILSLMRQYDKYGLENHSENEVIAQAQSEVIFFMREKVIEIVNGRNVEI